MRIKDAIKYFHSAARLSRELGFESNSVVYNWVRRDGKTLVPELYARRLDEMTGGELKFDPREYGLERRKTA